MTEEQLKQKIKELEKIVSVQKEDMSSLDKKLQEIVKLKQMFDSFLQEIPDSIYFKDLNSRFILINEYNAIKLGLKEPSEGLMKTDFDFFSKEHAQYAFSDEQYVIKTGKPIIKKEELERWADGRETWVSTTKMPLRDENGKTIGTVGLSYDIGELKKTQEQLQALMENIPDTIYFKDTKSRFVSVNKACAVKHGFKNLGEITGKTDADIFNSEFAKATEEEEQLIMSTGKPLIGKEEFETFPDGNQYWMMATKMPWIDNRGRVIGTFGISRDITKIKRAEQRLQTLMDNIPDAIYFKDDKSRFTVINRSTAKNLGVKNLEDAYGKSDFDFYSKEHAQVAYDDELKMMKTGRAIIGKEELETWPDGTKRWVSSTKLPHRDHRGKIIGTFGLSRDIDRLKKAEEALQDSNDKLERKVAKRTEELRKANEGMKIRIQQLDYLNRKAHFFTQLIDRDTLLPAIFYAFVERFPEGEVHLVDMGPGGFRTVYSTNGLRQNNMLEPCIKALEYLETDKEEGLYLESSWTSNTLLKDLFNSSMKKYPCYVVIPLITDKKLRGVVQVFEQKGFNKIFRQESILLQTLASQSAMSLDNANNYRQLEERTRLKSELDIAHGIQKRFTPKDPIIPSFEIKGFCQPANEVGGDYLDFFQNNFGDWVLVIADVCGKGIPAALVMTSLRSIIRTEARDEKSSKKLLSSVNNLMGQDLQGDNSFITCMVLIIKKDGSQLNFTRAGHPMLISFSNKKEPKTVPSGGIALGMILGKQFEDLVEEVKLDLKTGDKFLAYTDGLDEAMNVSKETYGAKRLLKVLNGVKADKPVGVVEKILKDVDDFCGVQRQYDDLTLFALEKV